MALRFGQAERASGYFEAVRLQLADSLYKEKAITYFISTDTEILIGKAFAALAIMCGRPV
ncbi:hypothetical protein RU08_12690 [Pseudomonas fulva]|uniref:Uncharacterized protein n=1 Tax=Pseudomonas fulva TaxID=47880 RepID=A0A0D0JX84_9PSED|nr:hypothetical protein RU08_12690 [Pseudomonas fulva]